MKSNRRTWFIWWFFEKKIAVCNPSLKKQDGLYKIISIDNENMITVAINPKEHFKKLDKVINKKHEGVRKDAPGKIFECLRGKIMSIREYYDTNVKLPKNIIEKRFQIRNTVMKLDNANKL